MKWSGTLSLYFGKQFLFWVLGTFLAIMGIVYLLDAIELLRRGSDKELATLTLMLQMAALKAPQMGQTILPFATLFGAMLAFTRMTRSNELVVARAAGVSVWQFLLPALLIAFLIGVFKITVFNPVASVMTAKYEALENKILRDKGNFLSLTDGGLWLREQTSTGHFVLHATGVASDGASLSGLTVLFFEGEDNFDARVDAAEATLKSGFWQMNNVILTTKNAIPDTRAVYRLPTALTLENIQDSFSPPETMSFWELPKFISILESAGFSAVRHRLYWHALLASPLLLCAMVLIAATFSLRLTRRGGTMVWVSAGLFTGFFLYFASDLVFALGLSARIPEVLAAWTPATVTTLLGCASLLHLEDG